MFDLYCYCRPEEHIDMNASPPDPHFQPDCMRVTDLDFSMHAFEHLEVSYRCTCILVLIVHTFMLVIS